MHASVACHAPVGIDGQVVRVEADLRNGVPGIDIVGLPDSAVRESRERVRVAIRNSGFEFPRERVLVNLAPAGIRKEGASFDLAIAFAVLAASKQVPASGLDRVMVLGELNLCGEVLPVTGVLAAVATGIKAGLVRFLVPKVNLREALCLGLGRVCGIASLAEGACGLRDGKLSAATTARAAPEPAVEDIYGDLSDIRGCAVLKRALEVAAAGGHNLFLCGPPGSGKTMAARRLATLLPPLDRDESLEVTRVHSLAGALPPDGGLITRRPFRMPHHTASAEGIIGGGRFVRPGEVSLAHRGVLFLDEVLEFHQALLQSLREPAEDRWVTVVRAGSSVRYPAAFQLVLTANGCPCGQAGLPGGTCRCTDEEIRCYWKRLGGALLDRIDIRVGVVPESVKTMVGPGGESSAAVRERVTAAAEIQRRRYRGEGFRWNAEIPAGRIGHYCAIDEETAKKLIAGARQMNLSSRACHSVLKVARTIADLAGSGRLRKADVMEALQHRRYGQENRFWE